MSLGVILSIKKLKETMIKEATDLWDAEKNPLLLSKLGPTLKKEVPDYKVLMGDMNTRKFIEEEVPELRVIRHSTQPAKIGVIPREQIYSYDNNGAKPKTSEDHEDIKESRRSFYSFIRILSKLPKEEREQVVIPTNVIVRLLEGK